MRVLRVVLCLGLIVCFARGGEIVLDTENEEVVKDAEVVSISESDIVYKSGGKEIKKKISEVRKIDLREANKIDGEKKYAQVDLIDGTSLMVSQWALKGDKLEMTLLSGPEVKTAVTAVSGVLNNAWDEKYRSDWRNRLINTRGKSAVVLKRNAKKTVGKGKEAKEVDDLDDYGKVRELIFNFPCTIGEGDEKGETLEIAYIEEKAEKQQKLKQKDQHGIIWAHKLPTESPPRICKLVDTTGNVVMVAKLASKKDGLTVTTPAGAKLDFAFSQVSQIDYTTGRLDYLSEFPGGFKSTVTLDSYDAKDKLPKDYKWFVYKDSSLNMTPIKLGPTSYRHGLTLLPGVELEYDLNASYRQFDAVIGVDEQTEARGHVTLEIQADNTPPEIVEIDLMPKLGKGGEVLKPAKKTVKVSLNVKNVKTLTLKLKPKDELRGLSIGVSLGDARLSR